MLKTKQYNRLNNNDIVNASVNAISSSSDLLTFEYDINDLRLSLRNILTKGQFHDEICHYSGASISTRGRYQTPTEKSSGNIHDRPLYLFIQAATRNSLNLAIQKIDEIIQSDLTAIPTQKIMSKFMNRPPPQVMSTQPGPASTFVEKIMVGLDHAPPAFDLRGQLIGAGGANLHYIRNETGAIATLRGRGSLFIDPALGSESPEAMHLYIEHPRYEGLQAAKQLAKNLIETLQQELMHYQQINPPVPTVQYAQQQTVLQTQQQQIPQMSVPPPMLAVPPPIIQQNGLEHLNNTQPIMQQQHFITQNASSIVQPVQQGQQPVQQQQQQMIQHQAMLPVPQTVPIHLHPGNVVIQQQVQPAPSLSNVNIPPPGIIPVKQGPLVHFQGPPPPVHLSQPPPNIQLQQPQATQIVLNQPQQNYQYQYIQQSQIQANDVTGQSNQVTIQHIYQPQHQLQGIVQQTAQPTAQFNQFAQQIRPQQLQPGQQYIVQGSTAYMMPPPNIIHQQPQAAQPQNIIFQTQQPTQPIQQIPLQQIHQIQQQSNDLNNSGILQNHNTSNGGSNSDDNGSVKDENNKASPERDDSPIKTEIKTELKTEQDNANNGSIEINSNAQLRQQIVSQPQITTQIPPPVLAGPPPITCVQHIVGNTLISTSQPTATHTHQIYNQIPVSIQQIPGQQQQIHVSTQNGQHFLVNAQQWQPQTAQFQSVPQNSNIQSFHLATAAGQPIRHPNEIVVSNPAIISTSTGQGAEFRPQQQHILATSFNPHIQTASMQGMQVQFQPVQQQQQQQQQQQIMQTIPGLTAQQQQSIIEQQSIINNMPPPPTFSNATAVVASAGHIGSTASIGSGLSTLDTPIKLNHTTYQPGNSPQPVPYPQQKTNIIDIQQSRTGGQKRKIEDDDGGGGNSGGGGPIVQPRMGMGSNSGGNFLNNQRDGQPPQNGTTTTTIISSSQAATSSTTTTTSTAIVQDEPISGDPYSSPVNNGNSKQSPSQTIVDQQSPTSFSGGGQQQQDNRSYYQRDDGIIGGGGCGNNGNGINMNSGNGSIYQDGPRMLLDGPPGIPMSSLSGGPRGLPRYRGANRDFPYLMRPPHMPDGNFPMHRMNFGPPPPPPPPSYPHRGGDGGGGNGGGYGPPPPPHFRGQW